MRSHRSLTARAAFCWYAASDTTVSTSPAYLTQLRPDTNEVVIGEGQEVWTDTLVCDDLNFMAVEALTEPVEGVAKNS